MSRRRLKTLAPQWIFQKHDYAANAYAAGVLVEAHAVCRRFAAELRADGMRDAARWADGIAGRLKSVSDGATWADAFELDKPEQQQ